MSGVIVSVSLAIILLSPLIPTPRPQAISNQPWRVELLIGIFAIPFFFWVYGKRARNVDVPERVPLRFIGACSVLFVLWSGTSAFWALVPLTALFQTLVWGIYLGLFTAFLHLLRERSGWVIILATLSIVGGMIALLTLLDFLSIQEFLASQGYIRVKYAKFAELLLTAAPLICVSSIYIRRRKYSIITAIIWMLSWLAVMLSLSKGAFLAGITAHLALFAGCLLFSHKVFRKNIISRAAIWVVFTIAVQFGFSAFSSIPATADYISGKADKTRDTSMFRVNVWQVGSKMAADHWLIGVGSGNFGVAYNDSRIAYVAKKPDDRNPEYGEDYMFETRP